jgi:hypothetical protein
VFILLERICCGSLARAADQPAHAMHRAVVARSAWTALLLTDDLYPMVGEAARHFAPARRRVAWSRCWRRLFNVLA